MNLTQLINRNAILRGEQAAYSGKSNALTYSELRGRIAKLGGGLQALGVREEDCVAILSLNSKEYIESLFGIFWVGGVVNPVNTRWSADEVVYSLNDSRAKILIVDDSFVSIVEQIRSEISGLKHVIYAGAGSCPEGMENYETLIQSAAAVEDRYRNGRDLAAIMYTGGTTGFPKGVMVSHENLLNFPISLTQMAHITAEPRVLHCAPLFHIAGLGMLLTSLWQGGTQIVMPVFDPGKISEVIHEEQITDLLLVPTMVHLLMNVPGFDPAHLASVENIVYGASPMPIGTMKQALELLPHVGFVQGYGMTECGLITISPAHNHTVETLNSGLISTAGNAGPLLEVKIADPDDTTLPCREIGEVCMRGPNVMLGYWEKPDVTKKTIVDGWLHTGDAGYLDDEGHLFIVDRVKDMIITGGENVYSSEVETVISQHPLVSQCAVIGIPSAEWGEAVHAIIVLDDSGEEEQQVSIESLREFCKKRIAGYKCPTSLSHVEALPLSAAGKVLKTELRQPFWAGSDKQIA